MDQHVLDAGGCLRCLADRFAVPGTSEELVVRGVPFVSLLLACLWVTLTACCWGVSFLFSFSGALMKSVSLQRFCLLLMLCSKVKTDQFWFFFFFLAAFIYNDTAK